MSKKITVVTVLVASLILTGCNTIEGIGKDVKSAGKRVEKEAK